MIIKLMIKLMIFLLSVAYDLEDDKKSIDYKILQN